MKKGLVFLAGAAGAVWVIATVFTAPGERRAPADGASKEPPQAQAVQGLRMEGADPQGRRWYLDAANATADTKGAMGRLSGVEFRLETEQGPLRATAGACDVMTATGATLEGGVELVWGQWRATLDSARYLRPEGRILSESPVEVSGEGVSLHGQGIEIDVAAGLAHVKGRVHAVLGKKG